MTALKLYDLAAAEPDRRFSPYCWRTKLALAHKGLDVESIPWRFAQKPLIAPSGQDRVPVLVDGATWVSDSWRIAEYLEDAWPDRPSLFGGGAGRALARFHSVFADGLGVVLSKILLLDIYARLDPGDQPYFRASREARFGTTLEAYGADPERHLPEFRERIAPLRFTLMKQPFLGGETALYPDYCLFSAFLWARSMSPVRLLEPDDPVHPWRERMLDLHAGLARAAPGYD